MSLDKKCKHSVRYAQSAKEQGPVTIYIPNEWFEKQDLDLKDPPVTIRFFLEKGL